MVQFRVRLVTIAALCVGAAFLPGCGSDSGGGGAASSGSSGSSAKADTASTKSAVPPEPDAVAFPKIVPGSGKGIKIGYISLGESVPFVRLVSNDIKAVAKKTGAQLVFCDSQQDGQTALDCARNFKTQGVQGYLNFQPDAQAAAGICAAGPQVPVIAVDIEQPPCQKAFMGANNEYAGYLGGRAMGEYFKSKFNCQYDAFVSLEQPEAGAVNTARMGGFRKGFTEICGAIKNLRKENAYRIDMARQVFTDVLTALPGQHRLIVVAINDDGIEGALAAAKTANRTKDLFVSGTGVDPSAWCEIKNNPQWVADPAFFPERYGEIGVPYLIKLIKGQKTPSNLFVPHKLITGQNIDQYYDLSKC